MNKPGHYGQSAGTFKNQCVKAPLKEPAVGVRTPGRIAQIEGRLHCILDQIVLIDDSLADAWLRLHSFWIDGNAVKESGERPQPNSVLENIEDSLDKIERFIEKIQDKAEAVKNLT